MRMPRKLLFQVSYFSHCVYTFDTDSSEGNLQNTYCIKMFENFFMCYSIFGIILFHIFRNAQHFKFLWFKRFVRIRFDLMCQIMFVLPRVLKPFYNMSSIAAKYSSKIQINTTNPYIVVEFYTPDYFCVIFVQLTLPNCPGIYILIMQNF